MDSEFIMGVLVGVDRDASRQFLVFGIAIMALALLIEAFVWALRGVFGLETMTTTGRWLLIGLGIVAGLTAGANGYFNDGVLVGAVIALAPLVGVGFFLVTAPLLGLSAPSPTERGFLGLTSLVAVGGVLLTLIGAGAGRFIRGERSSPFES